MALATTVVSLFVLARYGVMPYLVGVIVFPLAGMNPVLMSFGSADIRASDVLFPVVLLALLSLSSIEGSDAPGHTATRRSLRGDHRQC